MTWKVLPKMRMQNIENLKSHPLWRWETALVGGAIVAGLASGMLAKSHEDAVQEQMREDFKTVSVVIAKHDILSGSTLDETNVEVAPMLGKTITANTVTADNDKLILGHVITLDLKQGDPILLSAVKGVADAKGMAERIPPGKRLFTLNIDGRAAGYGFVSPNDHVDIIATLDLPDRGITTFTLLEDVTLVSVGARSVLDNSNRVAGTDISFFVSPDDFELLAFAQKRGTFSLSLRNPKDMSKNIDIQSHKGIDLNKFLDHRIISGASGGGDLQVVEAGRVKKSAKNKAEN